MNETETYDDLERDVVRTLQAKAAQMAVEPVPYDADRRIESLAGMADSAASIGMTSSIGATGSAGRRARRMLAAAVLAVVLGGGAIVVAARNRVDHPTVSMADASALWSTMPQQGTAAFVPTTMPEGWTLTGLTSSTSPYMDNETWQLFAAAGASPLPRGVLVGSSREQGRVLGGEPTLTVHGQPARLVHTNNPYVPAEAIELVWADGDVFHDVVAVGLTETELLDFLETLVTRSDPVTGFDAPPGAALPELQATTVEHRSYSSFVEYLGPVEGDRAWITATPLASPGGRGGLLHRLVGETRGDGLVLSGSEEGRTFASWARADGWFVNVYVEGARSDGTVLPADTVLDALQPATEQQLVQLGLAQPVVGRDSVGGWTIERYGNGTATVAMCLTPDPPEALAAGEPVCTTATTLSADGDLVTASAIVDGKWVVVAVTDGEDAATVETAPSGGEPYPTGWDPQRLAGERRQVDGHVVEVVTIPADVEAVLVTIPIGDDQRSGFGYDRPAG